MEEPSQPNRRQKVKQHLMKHKTKYIVVSSVVVASGVTYVLTRRFGMPDIPANVEAPILNQPVCTIGDVADEATVLLDQSQNVVQHITNLANGGYCCKIVQDAANPTKMWPMIKDFCEEVAEENNTTPEKVGRMLYRYWEGKINDVYGHCPVRYGLATVAPKVA